MKQGLRQVVRLLPMKFGPFLYERVLYEGLHRVPRRPPILLVELTNRCNARCIMCDRQSMRRAEGLIDFALFQRAIDEAARFSIWRVNLNRFGEPLLHPQVVEMIRYAKHRGIREVSMVSNATLLDEDLTARLLESGLDKIIFSIDGARKETYERIRRGCRFEEVTDNVERFLRMRERRGLNSPYVQVSTLLMKETQEEVEEVVHRWSSLADGVRVGISVQYGNLPNYSPIQKEGLVRMARPCPELFWKLAIFWNGDVTVCCEDPHGKLCVGNIRETSLETLWQGERIRRIREIHFCRDFYQLPICAQCDGTNRTLVKVYRDEMARYKRLYRLPS